MIQRNQASGSLWPFALWLLVFYAVWTAIILGGGLWETVGAHWPIAAAMAVGSYFAGSTPMGGGTIGFPVLVLVFDEPATLGRNFSLAVQSIGMVSASIFLLSRRRPMEWTLLRFGAVGALVGTPLGAALIAPHVGDLSVKLLFSVVWASFGLMHFVKLREIASRRGISPISYALDRELGLLLGVTGGVLAAITGVGTDMLLYVALVLLYRADLKIAIPTSVVLMAFTSVVGIVSNVALAAAAPGSFAVEPEVFGNWLAAAPVVAVGAPFGTIVVNWMSRRPTLIVASVLCVAQFVGMCWHERVSGWPLGLALSGLLTFNVLFHVLYRWGSALTARTATAAAPGVMVAGAMREVLTEMTPEPSSPPEVGRA